MASTEIRGAGTVVILGTGGTIAGTAASPGDNVGYSAAQLSVGDLVRAVPPLAHWAVTVEQVAQIDSKDMDHATWLALAQRVAAHLAQPEVAGVVITHGTDTLEETAYFLHRVLAPAKPVVLTAAMRPATSLQADGPQNLLDAVTVARSPGAASVLALIAGQVHAGDEVRKLHTYRADAFGSGDGGPLAVVVEGAVRCFRPWPAAQGGFGLDRLRADPSRWPRVDVVTSHAGADGVVVDALVASGVNGIVVAGTGNATLHRELEAALRRAQAAGVRLLCVSRCTFGPLIGHGASALPVLGGVSPAQARVELMLRLMGD
jgi:L-asparaginase